MQQSFDVLVANRVEPRVAANGVVINAGQANRDQRSMVTALSVQFSAAVEIVAGAFVLERLAPDGSVLGAVGLTVTTQEVGGATVATLRFTGPDIVAGSLRDGHYRLRIVATLVTLDGVALDGNGDAVPGDDFTFGGVGGPDRFHRLFGDADGDGMVNAFDYGLFRPAYGATTGSAFYVEWLDFDGDGAINAYDYSQFRDRHGLGVP